MAIYGVVFFYFWLMGFAYKFDTQRRSKKIVDLRRAAAKAL